ncbi:D-alanyl-D-alanine carboxypeptidase/D-alanyl-D-alanine-endopeptidase [Bacteroides sp. 519]|uniref:D-alanyl-D-alanine carboxypeptidase/D-alanyl-D-alanine endopeptidase n=1 Tax=Bacteroides sp. 519 TaxID=2302937 RepID=UPI0013D1B091|nr:D-alanyl-D-alanine carboxypeptidase/D-alanyl-D-alanine-endopeptidase [Bacteroides sp. 519]NDV57573.1 D-alanyl-D-alanine carboxypeptidase/D-alanyl-D-alanine-endopeptidase [Bacteroides sp. 519]
MRKTTLLIVLFLIGLSPAWGQTGLQQRLDKLIEEFLPPGSEIGVSVYDLTSKKQLYAYRDDKLSRPASVMKLLTTITALDLRGGTEPFQTHAWYKGVIEQDTLHGDLYVVGGFDPEFGDAEMDTLVSRVTTLPFSVITGKVYADVTMKDSLYWGSGWAWDDTPSSFQPYLSPLMFHKGMVKITATPTMKGDTASVVAEPVSSFYTLVNQTESRTPAAGKFVVSRNWLENGNEIVVKGNVASERTGEVNIYHSQDFFMHTFIERLRNDSIEVDNIYGYKEFMADSTAVLITRLDCPIQNVLSRVMKKSDNLSAEALLYRLAAQCEGRKRVCADDGLKAINRLIQRIGHNPKDYKIADGCGLSNYNYLSPALLVDFLKFAYSRTTIYQYLYKALPTAGVDGTLQNRMKGESIARKNVFAKTGSFTAISTLAGYARNSKGNDIAFAIMNQNVIKLADARKLQDKICEILCE